MKKNRIYAKQPILDRDENIVAYELLYRDITTGKSNFSSDLEATLQLLDTVIPTIEMEEKEFFLKVDEEFLLSKYPEIVPKERFVLEILEKVRLSEQVIERMKELREQGLKMALGNLLADHYRRREVYENFDIIKVDVITFGDLKRVPIKEYSSQVIFVAKRVETREQFNKAKEFGFSLFQGYFFAEPQIRRQKIIEPHKASVIAILGKFFKKPDIQDIVKSIKQDPELTFKLLQYVNSSYFSLPYKIESVQRAVMFLGLEGLKTWLYMMLYTSQNGKNALFEVVQNRALLMEELAPLYNVDPDEAYLTGLLSLLHVALQMDQKEIVSMLPLSQEIEDALLLKRGSLGKMLLHVEQIERDESPKSD